MAYVFGIGGVPIFEMLFVISLLLLAGLIFILLELRRLNSLIGKEKTDLKRFETDLQEFESDTGKKASAELDTYVKKALESGLSREQIEESLLKRGWAKDEIDEVINRISKS
ncbi:hypothetical protein AYK26_02040 [Euryarchaeota archaeon SM23-78]|nr:MAG: hypothetical protein AYK26_02040 [Euryarchaeota archaeon SM23-78]